MNSEDIKICINCKHCFWLGKSKMNRSAEEAIRENQILFCKHPINTDVVTGKIISKHCRMVRNDESACGIDGKLYEAN
jgi:hypothetical protein